jgi:hypothetical protein
MHTIFQICKCSNNYITFKKCEGQDGIVSTATCYGLDYPGFTPNWWSETFQNHPHQPQDQPSLLHNGLWVSFPCVKQLGRGATMSTPSSSEVEYG